MMETNSVLSNRGSSSLSADEIAQLLGFADAAAMVAASVQYVLATGGTTNYVAAPALALTPVNGTMIAVRFPSDCAANATLNVSGSGAKTIMLRTQAGERATAAGDLLSGGTYVFSYSEDFGGLWIHAGGSHLKAADIPSTLNTTTMNGLVVGYAASMIYNIVDNSSLSLYGGSSNGTSRLFLHGGTHSTKPGNAEYYCGSASGAAHSFFDKNGVERQRTQEDGVTCISPVVSVGTSFTTICAVSGNQALLIATVTGIGSILLEWDGSTLSKLAGVATLVVAGSAGAGETAFRVSGGNLQAIVDTGTRNVSSGFSVRH